MAGNILEVRDLSISFRGIKAVQNLSFDIKKGEVLALIGPNGSGKSTTVNMISGVYIPTSGNIKFGEHMLNSKITVPKRAKLGIGRTFQTPKPFANLTVFDNIFTIALQHNSFKKAEQLTEEILAMSKLDGFRDMNSGKLSIEKRKWLDLARILVTNPSFIMMDEVMAGLNPSEMEESLELVREINKRGITILFIEHVMKAVTSICTRAIVLNEGKLLFEGGPREALSNPSVIKAYIGGDGK